MFATDCPVIVKANGFPACPSVHAVLAHHRDFPEILGEGETPERAASSLLNHLTAAIDSVGGDRHREVVLRAILDVRTYLAGLAGSVTSARGTARPLE
jgi:hypothetical protein